MKILFVAAEATPLVQVGGLAEVIGSLPQALIHMGHDVRLILPKYGCIDTSLYEMEMVEENIAVNVKGELRSAVVKKIVVNEMLPIYLVENEYYFGRQEVYTDDDVERFLYFSQVVVKTLGLLDWQPDIVHCHDWHSAMVIRFLKHESADYGTLFTIHNLAYQGKFDSAFLLEHKLEHYWDNWPFYDIQNVPMNLMVQGILWADMVNAVSETYAQEITTPEYGEGLDLYTTLRGKYLVGILNGIDYVEYNPEGDQYIPGNYGVSHLSSKVVNKLALQKQTNLRQSAEIPLIGMVQRMDEQKGIDILMAAINPIMQSTNAQFAILGHGQERYENQLRQIACSYPDRIAVKFTFNTALAHLIYASCDIFLLPSKFEPCGLGQLIAMRYGALPIVRHTGGLVDTVPQFNKDLSMGNGFVFCDYTAEALADAVKLAAGYFTDRVAWNKAVARIMQIDFSWSKSAHKYDFVYRQISENKMMSSRKIRGK